MSKINREKVQAIVNSFPDRAVVISEVVSALATQENVSLQDARYIVRDALDRGSVHTDSKFKLCPGGRP